MSCLVVLARFIFKLFRYCLQYFFFWLLLLTTPETTFVKCMVVTIESHVRNKIFFFGRRCISEAPLSWLVPFNHLLFLFLFCSYIHFNFWSFLSFHPVSERGSAIFIHLDIICWDFWTDSYYENQSRVEELVHLRVISMILGGTYPSFSFFLPFISCWQIQTH